MKTFTVVVQRYQTQTATFTVKAKSEDELKEKLAEIDFGQIDHCFDEGEVESIEYEATSVTPTKNSTIDEELQDLLN